MFQSAQRHRNRSFINVVGLSESQRIIDCFFQWKYNALSNGKWLPMNVYVCVCDLCESSEEFPSNHSTFIYFLAIAFSLRLCWTNEHPSSAIHRFSHKNKIMIVDCPLTICHSRKVILLNQIAFYAIQKDRVDRFCGPTATISFYFPLRKKAHTEHRIKSKFNDDQIEEAKISLSNRFWSKSQWTQSQRTNTFNVAQSWRECANRERVRKLVFR